MRHIIFAYTIFLVEVIIVFIVLPFAIETFNLAGMWPIYAVAASLTTLGTTLAIAYLNEWGWLYD